jgi:hypothetical protein
MLAQRLNSFIVAPRSNSNVSATRGLSNENVVTSSAVIQSVAPTAAENSMRPGLITTGSLHPNTPGSLAMLRRSRVRKA